MYEEPNRVMLFPSSSAIQITSTFLHHSPHVPQVSQRKFQMCSFLCQPHACHFKFLLISSIFPLGTHIFPFVSSKYTLPYKLILYTSYIITLTIKCIFHCQDTRKYFFRIESFVKNWRERNKW